jgi:hypothetical protein
VRPAPSSRKAGLPEARLTQTLADQVTARPGRLDAAGSAPSSSPARTARTPWRCGDGSRPATAPWPPAAAAGTCGGSRPTCTPSSRSPRSWPCSGSLGVPPGRVTLICIGEYPGIAHFGGLGELEPGQLPGLLDVAMPLTAEALDLGVAAWAALRAADPGGLGGIAASRSPELRFLGEAFDRLSREYPSTRDGLSLTERRILAAAGRRARGEVAAATRLRLTADGRRVLGGEATTWRRAASTAGSAGSTWTARTALALGRGHRGDRHARGPLRPARRCIWCSRRAGASRPPSSRLRTGGSPACSRSPRTPCAWCRRPASRRPRPSA